MDAAASLTLLPGLMAELRRFLPAEEAEELLRRAGRRFAESASAEERPALLEGLPIRVQGDHYVTAWDLASGSIAWCAGLLEGMDPDQRFLEAHVAPQGVELRWTPRPSGAKAAAHFELPESGPLSPYLLAQVADLCVDAILFIDREHRIRSWNLGAQRMFGYRPEEALGAYYDLLVPDDLRASGELEEIGRSTEAAGQVKSFVTRRRTKEGRDIHVSLSRTLVHDARGELVGFGVILRDVSESERLKSELESSRQMAQLGELAAQVAHEIRNPLAGISGALQILQRRLDVGPSELEVFEGVHEEIDRLSRTVSDLLQFGRPAQPHTVEVELGDWLSRWNARRAPSEDQPRASVELTLNARPRVALDPALFAAVLSNLVKNSCEAGSGECELELRVGTEGRHAVIDVLDNGPGIPDIIRKEVLKPFYTTKPRGSGLGLAICQRHLALHGGSIEILPSERGGWIRLRLPRIDDGPAPRPPA